MFKVNSEKILQEYNELYSKRLAGINRIETEARAFAANRGYDEAQTIDFVEYVQEIENFGLTETELDKFDFLGNYVELVSDENA